MGGGGGLLLFFGGSLARANRYGKKHCRILFWRIRAALKKALDNGKPRFRFQYDSSSYALNFDDGTHHFGDSAFHQSNYQVQRFCYTTTTWIYVFWVESSQIQC